MSNPNRNRRGSEIDLCNELVEFNVGAWLKKKRESHCRYEYVLPHFQKYRKSLRLLENYKEYKSYFEKGIIPDLRQSFEKNLFNTFLCYIDHKKVFPISSTKHKDNRGVFVETIKLNSWRTVFFFNNSTGITRGNHFHTRKAERFAVIKGKAKIELRKIGTQDIISFQLDGENPSFVDMPIWYTHNITNIGDEDLYTVFWINEHYNSEDADTYFEQV